MRIALFLSRLLFGFVFIFSGFVKAIDPLGSAYKFQDYFLAFGLEWLYPLALIFAVLLSTLEFVIGVAILLRLNMRYTAWGAMLFMAFFTPLTLFIAITDPVPDCGCFGDAIIISNWETFYKNLIILAAAMVVFRYRTSVRPLLSEKKDWAMNGVITLVIMALSVYCLRNLPVIDFRPWKIGNNVLELVIPTPEEADLYLIYRNKETGEVKEYPSDNFPWDDPEWVAQWEYHDQRKEVTRAYIPAPIDGFYIEDEFGEDLTDYYISYPDYLFVIVAPDLFRTNTKAFKESINPLALSAEENGYPLIVLTASSFETMEDFRHIHQTPYPFYLSDDIELKTIIRSNPGLVLLKNGVVKGKWAFRNIPSFDELQDQLEL
jgi:uncharacterized membrane protein YphA (DoxX/SURF4 family)